MPDPPVYASAEPGFPLLVATSRTQTRSHSVCRGCPLPYSYHINTAAAKTTPPAEQWLHSGAAAEAGTAAPDSGGAAADAGTAGPDSGGAAADAGAVAPDSGGAEAGTAAPDSGGDEAGTVRWRQGVRSTYRLVFRYLLK